MADFATPVSALCAFSALFFLSISSFHRAVGEQLQFDFFPSIEIKYGVCGLLLGLGQLFVLSSFYKLGITGTFLGDYCGILMESRVTGFPFNVLDNPMYVGSTMSFLGYSLYYGSPAGLLITVEVFIVYQIALMFEGSVARHSPGTSQGAVHARCLAVVSANGVLHRGDFCSCHSHSPPSASLLPVLSPYTTKIYLERDAARKNSKKAQ